MKGESMRSKFIGLLIIALLAVSLLATFPIPVRADPDLDYSPQNVYLTIPAGGSGSFILTLSDNPNRETTYKYNGTVGIRGQPQLDESWVSVDPYSFTRNGSFSVNVIVTITVPSNASSGTYAGKLKYTPKEGSGCNIYVTVVKAEISIDKSANATEAYVGDTIRYTYTVKNTGSVPLSNVYVYDDKLGTFTYNGTLSSGATWTFYKDYIVPEDAPDELTNMATAYGKYGTTTVNATDSCTVTIRRRPAEEPSPSISINKYANVTMAHVGDTIKYTYEVSNTGNVPLSSVSVEDSLGITVEYVSGDANEDELLDTDETWTFEAEYTVPSDAPDELTNTATAYGTYDTTNVSATASCIVTILKPEISVTKTADRTMAHEGDEITYTITVKNTGNCELTDVTVIDDVLGDLTGYLPDRTLNVGEENTIIVTYTVEAGDPDPLVNTVTAEGEDALGLKVDASAEASVDLVAKICGCKFYDADTDGVRDENEQTLAGFKIELYVWNEEMEDWVYVATTFTDEYGDYCFDELNAGNYTVEEVLPTNWVNTTSTSIMVELLSGEISEGNNFGNVCLKPGAGGRTIGYWANAGNKLITREDVIYLNSLKLYTPNGWKYPPFATNNGNNGLLTARAQIRTYLLRATAVDMRWMLSAQLIATVLNVRHGYLDSSTIVYVRPSTYVPSGFIKIGEIIIRANTALAGTNRTEQEYWKNILDDLNNNRLPFVCKEPCYPITYT